MHFASKVFLKALFTFIDLTWLDFFQPKNPHSKPLLLNTNGPIPLLFLLITFALVC